MDEKPNGQNEKSMSRYLLSLSLAFVLFFIVWYFGPFKVALSLELASVFLAITDDLLVRIFATILLAVAGVGLVAEEFRRMSEKESGATEVHESDEFKKTAENPGKKETEDPITKTTEEWVKKTERKFQPGQLMSRKYAVFKFAALAAFSGLGFVAAEGLDNNDGKANLRFLKDPQKFLDGDVDASNGARIPAATPAKQTTLARWAQVVPRVDDKGNSACVFEPDQDITAENAPQDCPYDFLVRAVVPFEKDRCPHVTVAYASGSQTQPMKMRANPYKWGFGEIMVCQTRVKDNGESPLSAQVADEPPILLSKNWTDEGGPGTVAVIGDTGCRANKEQICTEENWRFGDVARRLAPEGRQAKPDLVIHVGDYMYMKFDSWDAWKAAFFDPAAPLLNAVPWIMVRGNHERCGPFGDAPLGYYLFLDIGDPQHLDCKDEAERTATYAVDIAGDRRVIVSDSATAWSIWASNRNGALKKGKQVPSPGKEQQQDAKVANDMKRMLRQAGHLAAGTGARQTWFTTHVPVFSLGGMFKDQTPKYVSDPASFTMRQAWYALGAQRPAVDAILAGHLHLFQVAQATKHGDPLQIISGAGGVNIDDDLGLPNSDKGGKTSDKGGKKCLSRDNWAAYDQIVDMPIDKQSPPATTAMHVCSNENIGYVLINKDKQGASQYVFTPLD